MKILEKKVGDLTAEELEQLLEQKRTSDIQQKQKAKEAYEDNRNQFVTELVREARQLNKQLADFKNRCFVGFEEFRAAAHLYGDIRSNSKGGFGLRNSESGDSVRLDRNLRIENDERLELAIPLVKEFLEDTVKKRSLADYKTISALLSKNKKGDYSPSRLAVMISQKSNYTDKRWIRAIELIEESFVERDVSYSVSFFEKDAVDKDQPIVLNFSAIDVIINKEEEAA